MEMNKEMIYSIVLAVVMAVGIVLTFIIKPTKDPAKLRGRVSRVLNKFAAPRKFRVLDHVTIEGKDGLCTIDHVLVGWFGILFVNDLLLEGDYTGNLIEGDWICTKTNRQDERDVTRLGRVENPLVAAREFEAAARALLTTNKVACPAMESVVVTAYNKGKFFITGSKDLVFNLRTLRSYLSLSAWIQKDAKADVERICNVLSGKA